MHKNNSELREATDALRAIAAEADELQRAAGGSVTDVVAEWLAPQYALVARKRLAALKGDERLKFLRAFVQDWALLRQGDQTAERLQIERERLTVARQDADLKWKRKTIIGLEVFMQFVARHPAAKKAFAELARQVRHPFDPGEQDLGEDWPASTADSNKSTKSDEIRPNPTESDR